MADEIRTATASIVTRTDTRGIEQAKSAFQSLHDVVRDNWWGIRNVGLAFAGIGGAIASGVAGAIGAAASFEDGMIAVERTTMRAGESSEQTAAAMGELGEKLRAIALTKPVGLDVITRIASQAGALGVARENVVEFTSTMVDLIATTNVTEASLADLARIAAITNLPADQYDNLASAIFEAGVKTAATETEILNLTRRLAPAATLANMSAAEIVGLSAAILSLGSRAEAGSTAISKTLGEMALAIADGGSALQNFAVISGLSMAEFERVFRESGGEALTLFIEGLGRMGNDSVAVTKALDSLGISEARQRQALLSLARGTQNAHNEFVQLRNTMGLTEEAFRKGNALQLAAARQYRSTSSQIKIMKNTIRDAGISFGTVFLPVINFVVQRIADFAHGLANLPGPLKALFVGLVLAAGLMAAIAAATLLLVPRILLAAGAFAKLSQEVTGATLKQMLWNTVAAATGASGVAAGAGGAAAAVGIGAAGGAAAAATPAVTGFAAAVAFATGGLSLIIPILGVLGVGISAVGARKRKEAKDTLESREANQELLAVLREENKTVNESARAWTLRQLAQNGALTALNHFKISARDAVDVILGIATEETSQRIVASLQAAADAGDELAKELLLVMKDLNNEIAVTIANHNLLNSAEKELGVSVDRTGFEMSELADQTDEAADAMNRAANAAMSLPDLLLSIRQATYDLEQAQERYNEALAAEENQAERVAEAEDNLLAAKLRLERANRDLADAEEKLASARADALEELEEAERDLADARERYDDSQEKIIDAQEKLNKLMSGPTVDELRDATNKLANAQLKLVDAEQKAADSQWMLNYLREEGASARDISDAENVLADANQDVLDVTDEVIDATEDLADLRDGASAEELEEAEEDLARAYRDNERALEDLIDAEEKVGDLREDIAKDTAYKDAQLELIEAQQDVAEAERDAAQAARDLAEARSTDRSDELTEAELDLESAVLRVAQAHVDAARAAAEARGETFSDEEAMDLYRQTLLDLADDIGGPVGARLRELAGKVHAVPSRKTTTFKADTKDFDLAPGRINQALAGIEEEGEKSKGIWERIWDGIKGKAIDFWNNLPGIINSVWQNAVKHIPFAGPILDAWNKIDSPKVREAFKSFFSDMPGKIGGWFKEKVGNIDLPGIFRGALGGGWRSALDGIFSNLGFSFPTQLFSGFSSGFGSGFGSKLGQVIASPFRGAFGGAATLAMRGFASPIQSFLDTLHNFQWKVKVPGWVPIWGGNEYSIGFPKVQLPMFAKGGIVNSPTMGIIGEAGPEAVIPLTKLFAVFEETNRMLAHLVALEESMRKIHLADMSNNQPIVHHHYEKTEVSALTQADPQEIADEIVWLRRTRVR